MTSETAVQKQIPMATLLTAFGPDLEFAKDMAPLTSYQTGGRARYFYSAHSAEEITRAVRSAQRLDIPYFVLGGGTNLLVSDDGFDGVVIKVDVPGIALHNADGIRCGAGEQLMALVDFATANSLSGLEFAAGIWGTVGGAIYGNAGAFGGEIGSKVSELVLADSSGNIKKVGRDYCHFAYRDSYLKTSREVVVEIFLKLQPAKRELIAGKVKEILASRDGKHPNDGMSAGCFSRTYRTRRRNSASCRLVGYSNKSAPRGCRSEAPKSSTSTPISSSIPVRRHPVIFANWPIY